ncbi:septum formation initiator family protein [Patulibacter defluvii]|uniref:septum formation initiator family protein n=1 Tax=Patulibacter defluvii TaxID=3095358 RepID=UPI002A74BB47|nr:septum formation initiator family protein [Patulibacter sp. DM4]
MSSATTTAPRRRPPAGRGPSRSASGRRPSAARGAGVELAWPRIRRIALVLVLILLASSYVRPVIDWFGARDDAAQQQQRLTQLTQTEQRLKAEKARLTTERGLAAAARQLGMVREGERVYVVSGLPKD